MAKEDAVSTPKSVVEREAPVEMSAPKVTTTASIGGGGLRSADKANELARRKLLQERINSQALMYVSQNPAKGEMDEVVLIRALKTHHPAPRVGKFNFQDVYNCFVEGMKYKCPRSVGIHLEETENAVILS